MKKSFLVGIFLLLSSVALALIIFFPIIKEELRYFFSTLKSNPTTLITTYSKNVVKNNTILAVNSDFSIIIPKIGANTKVIKNVDPNNSAVYQQALSQGVAHAKGSALPNTGANTFLFAHSSDNFINANRYNSVFYLLYKLKEQDKIYLAYEKEILQYSVLSIRYVAPEDIEFLSPNYGNNTLTLMTCWPPGTTLKRLVVIAELVESDGV